MLTKQLLRACNCLACFCCAALLPPGAAMYPAIHKQLTRRAVLSTAVSQLCC